MYILTKVIVGGGLVRSEFNGLEKQFLCLFQTFCDERKSVCNLVSQ